MLAHKLLTLIVGGIAMLCHLLVATDLSRAAGEVYHHTAALSRLTGARVTLLSVNESHLGGLPASSVSATYLKRVEEERVQALLAARRTLHALGVEAIVRSGRGEPAGQICAFARAHDVDLVLMGKRGAGNPRRALGRALRRTLRRIRTPVMVVPPPPGGPDVPRLPSYDQLLAAMDFSEASRLSLGATVELAGALGARVVAVHVLWPPAMLPPLPRLPPLPAGRLSGGSEHRTAEELRQAVVDAVGERGARSCETRVLLGTSIGESLSQAARSAKASLVTISSHGRRNLREVVFGSTTEDVLRLAERPVVVFPLRYLTARQGAVAPAREAPDGGVPTDLYSQQR